MIELYKNSDLHKFKSEEQCIEFIDDFKKMLVKFNPRCRRDSYSSCEHDNNFENAMTRLKQQIEQYDRDNPKTKSPS